MDLRITKIFEVNNPKEFKQQLITWAQQYETIVWLDGNEYEQKFSNFDACLAVDEFTSIKTDYHHAFDKLKEYQSNTQDYIFGYIGYDVKNDVEKLTSTNFDGLNFADLFFFQPKKIITIKGNKAVFEYLQISSEEINRDFNNITEIVINVVYKNNKKRSIEIKERITKEDYIQKIKSVINYIQRGDIYEANFCQEFYAENTSINPLEVYNYLNEISKPPFATFFKMEDQYVLSASPERYLKKEGQKIISQPIKGTAKRAEQVDQDFTNASELKNNKKELAENIMIVDLVRNDLSHTATRGSVRVDELCKLYSFKQVHQLISTITSNIDPTTDPIDVIRTTFPMGSMTGAPKISAMKIIEKLEETKRGVYSGAIGYITLNEDFDFNVVIRSILYNQTKEYVSFSVGGAITSKSIPEQEYEECMVKAKAMKIALEND